MKSTSSLTRSYQDPAAPLHLRWTLPPSKSLWARALLLDALRGKLPHFDFAEGTPLDILALYAALLACQEGAEEINVSESGTAMRFVCAYLAVTTQHPVRLSGTGRQHKRPIAPLVEALRSQGAKITYLNHEGYPPLLIEPSTFTWQGCELDTSSSSQYLSALLLLAPTFPTGFEVDTRRYGLASRPYALMTIAQLREQGFVWGEEPSGLFCYRGKRGEDSRSTSPHDQGYEADWSAASYAYALLSLLPIGSTIELSGLALPSLQGDAAYLVQLFTQLGVHTEKAEAGICLTHTAEEAKRVHFTAHMSDCPDLVPAVVAALVGRGESFMLSGVAHLRIKESDRLQALADELAKLGVKLTLGPDSLSWDGKTPLTAHGSAPTLSPHGDHRIAMALALLALRVPKLRMQEPEVVAKSFPCFWQEVAPCIIQQTE